ncbi:isoprenyl transferase [soil metagenome]
MPNDKSKLPKHVGIIMDGNRRWAKQHKLESAFKGHEYVVNQVIEELVDACVEQGIPYLTLWAFSTENWKRSQEEVEGLMGLFRNAFAKQSEDLHKKGVRLKTIGNMSRFPKDIQEGAAHWQELSKKNTKITVTFALNYGGRDEILRAIHRISPEKITDITEEEFSQLLDTSDLPDPDLIIRTGGDVRTSGFMPWQATYAEYYYTSILMPDFTKQELQKALDTFAHSTRNFGK